MNDRLKDVMVDVHCRQCGDFTVGADVIAESQHLLETGCPGSPYECPATLFASLLDLAHLGALETAWSGLGSAARESGRRVPICDALCVAVRSNPRLDPRGAAMSREEEPPATQEAKP